MLNTLLRSQRSGCLRTTSSVLRPNNCSGLSQAIPNGPSVTKSVFHQPDFAIDGSISVYAQTADPAESPAAGPTW